MKFAATLEMSTKKSNLLTVLAGSVLIVLLLCSLPLSLAGDKHIKILRIEESINPGTAAFLARGAEQAVEEDAVLLVVELDTPGGLVTSMRTMIKTIMNAPIPVVVFVSPSGAQAASAGVFVVMAADIAAMAPGTNIGAAHPVVAGGKDMDETMDTKVVNDLVAFIKSIATRRGRNAEWAEEAVRKSVSVTAEEALKLKVIDLVAKDVDDLLAKLEGWSVQTKEGEKKLALKGLPAETVEENLRDKILKTISNPNIAYLLMLIGMAAFYAFQTLSVNYAGVLLIILGAILFLLEIKVTSYGMLSVGGVICLTLGSVMLFNTGTPGLRISWSVLIPAVLVISGFFITVALLAVRAHMAQPRTGYQGLIGEIAVAKESLAPDGKVFVRGELWNATSEEIVPVGARVEVIGVENLLLKVRKIGDTKQ
jgi:membrane-bound serine protease (ClpP class)